MLFAQKKTSDEVKKWDEAWSEASREYSQLRTRVMNIIAVHDGVKEKAKLPSIKDLTEEEERSLIRRMLKYYITEKDGTLSADELVDKYRSELEDLCTIDKDTVEAFGSCLTHGGFLARYTKFNVIYYG